MNELLKSLNMKEISPLFDECFEKIKDDTSLPYWLTEEFIKNVHQNYGILPTQLDNVLFAREQVAGDSSLVQFAKVLYEMLALKADGREIFENFAFPELPNGKNLVGVFPMLAHYTNTYDELKSAGVKEDVLKITFSMLDLYLSDSSVKRDFPIFGTGALIWTNLAKCKHLFRIDRLNLEIREDFLKAYGFKNAKGEIKILMEGGTPIAEDGFYKKENPAFVTSYTETDEYYEGNEADSKTATAKKEITRLKKSEWTPFYKPGDRAISVHIPMAGSFEPALVESSLLKGKEFLKRHFPEIQPTAYFCYSWLLAPELELFLKEGSNVLSFQDRFSKYPSHECCCKDIFTYVYHLPLPDSLEEFDFSTLPEETSLQKKIKDHCLSGKRVHEASGLYPYL